MAHMEEDMEDRHRVRQWMVAKGIDESKERDSLMTVPLENRKNPRESRAAPEFERPPQRPRISASSSHAQESKSEHAHAAGEASRPSASTSLKDVRMKDKSRVEERRAQNDSNMGTQDDNGNHAGDMGAEDNSSARSRERLREVQRGAHHGGLRGNAATVCCRE